MAPEVVVDKPDGLRETLLGRLQALAAEAYSSRGRFALGLPGGSVAEAFLPAFPRAQVDWTRADLFWGDERAVPPDHPDSNYGAAVSLWLKDAGLPASRIHPMPADEPDLEAAAAAYESLLVERLGSPPALDAVLMGMGPDGHVCSLFPGHRLLEEEVRFVAPIDDSPKPPPRRLTLTLPALRAARLVVVAAFGASKAPPLKEGLRDPGSRLPVALVLRQARQSLLLLDAEAAGR
jgi:6-phosphogluconolactonase